MTQRFQQHVRTLAYDQTSGSGPGIVFLGGFRSDKSGTKALYLEDWARKRDRAFLKFDYSGHGASAGDILDHTIGDWVEDAQAIFRALTRGRQILVGSSMGGWIALLLALRMPDRIAGMVTVAAAPDFTEEHYWKQLTDEQRAAMEGEGQIEVESEYDEAPYVITHRLIENGRNHLVLKNELPLPFPTRFLHGTEDNAVPVETALRLFRHASGPDIRLTLVKGADHRFSNDACLKLLGDTLSEVSGQSA